MARPSPSELNGRKIGSMLHNISTSVHSDRLVERHTAQLQHDTKGHSMNELPVGSTVGYRDHTKNQFNVGIISERNGRLYAITTESGQNVGQNCIDWKCTNMEYTR